MIVNRNSGNTQFVRTNQTKQAKGGGFGEALNKASYAKDTFDSSSVSGTAFTQSEVSSVPATRAKLDSISAAIENADYSGMTKAEIYADIEKRYEGAFDDYYASRAIWTCQDYSLINCQFITDVRNKIGRLTDDIIHEARGYSGTSYEEIEAEIKEKYAGKTGFVDQLNLYGELFTSGVLTNKYGREADNAMNSNLNRSLDLRGFNECILGQQLSKDEWLRRVDETGASSPFSLLLNSPYLSLAEKELFKLMVDDILFGVVGVTK